MWILTCGGPNLTLAGNPGKGNGISPTYAPMRGASPGGKVGIGTVPTWMWVCCPEEEEEETGTVKFICGGVADP